MSPLRWVRWSEVVPAGRMVASAYTRAPLPHAGRPTRAVLTALATCAMVVLLAVYRPFLRHWTDPHRPERATLVSIVPRGGEAVAALRGVVGIFVPGAILLPFALFVPAHPLVRMVHGLAFLLVMLALLVGVLAIAVGGFVPLLPYPGKIRRSGPGVPGTQLTINLAASTSSGGMRAVRAYLVEHHSGQRLTVRARDQRALALYRALGLGVVEPGAGRMTGIIPANLQ